MAVAAGGGRDYPEPVTSWLSFSRLRFLLIVLVLAAFYSVCFKKRKLDENSLVAGASIVGGAKLVEFLSDGSPCVSY